MPTTYLVLTAIGDDRPGLVGELSTTISAHQGNWLEASMSRLAGQFAGIVRVAVPATQAATLQAALHDMAGLRVTATQSVSEDAREGKLLFLDLVGHDRVGIVREVSQILARRAVNVENLNTRTVSAPMSAEILFHANAELRVPPNFDTATLKAELEKLSDELMVDISIVESN